MKVFKSLICLSLLMIFILSSCSKYLDKAPAANITAEDVFSTWANFQGFIEQMKDDEEDPIYQQNTTSQFNIGGDDLITPAIPWWQLADYATVMTTDHSYLYNPNAQQFNGTGGNGTNIRQGIWQNSWFAIRDANIAISHLNDLQVATAEQRNILEGEAYFYRGFFYSELIKNWGAVPIVDTVLLPSSNLNIPVLGLYVTIESALKDLQHAAGLLPVDWDLTVTGQATLGENTPRATKGMALGIEADLLMFAASPLCNGVVNGSYTYNLDYCKRAASAAWQVIQIANQGTYALEPWATYSNMFWKNDMTNPRSKEIIFQINKSGPKDDRYYNGSFIFPDIGNSSGYASPTENYVELFEMANGLPITDPQSGYDPMNPWINRDPRFGYNIVLDGDRRVKSLPDSDPRTFVQFYVGGRDNNANVSHTGYGFKKFYGLTVNNIDQGIMYFMYQIPKLRLAEIYLIYAEMANEAYGPNGKDPSANLSAVDAVNIVRNRANMPDVNPKFLDNIPDFRARIWNERAVELAFEGKRWYDIRRWHVASLPQYTQLYGLNFDKAHTYFQKSLITTVPFAERNYWMPFPISQVNLYSGWKQNPGW